MAVLKLRLKLRGSIGVPALVVTRSRVDPAAVWSIDNVHVLAYAWDEETALANLAQAPEEPLGAALLDQRNLAGIGTIYASEPLFLQRQAPWMPIGEVTGSQLAAALSRARKRCSATVPMVCPAPGGR